MDPETTHRSRFWWWWRPLVFLAGLVAIFTPLFINARRVYLDYNDVEDRAELAEMRRRKVLLLGTSHAADLNLAVAGLDGVDMSHGGQDLFEMAYIARTVKQRSRKLDTVLVSLSYFSFSFDNSAYVQDGVQTRVGRRISLYTDFRRLGFIDGDATSYVKGVLYPLVTADHYKTGFEALAARLTPGGVVMEPAPAPPDEPESKGRPKSYYADHAKSRCKSFREYARNMSEHHPGLAQDAFESTLELVRDLQAAGIRVVFFTPPFTRAYNKCFDKTYVRQLRELAGRLEKETGAPYFDFSEDKGFVDQLQFFDDSDHLSRRGARAFSRRFRKALDHHSQ